MSTVVLAITTTILGVLLGIAGTLYIERKRAVGTKTKLLKGLLRELRDNGSRALQYIHIGAKVAPYSSEVWQSVRFDVADFLDERVNYDLTRIYADVPLMELLTGRPLLEQDAPIEEGQEAFNRMQIEDWLQRIRAAMDKLTQLPEVRGLGAKWRLQMRIDEHAVRDVWESAMSVPGEILAGIPEGPPVRRLGSVTSGEASASRDGNPAVRA